MAVRDFGDLRAQNQLKVCPNFGDFRVQTPEAENLPEACPFLGI